MTLIDITQPLRPGTPIFPGDQPLETRWTTRIADGSSVNVGAATLSLHTGTHADAPLHAADGGTTINRMPLAAYIGPCIVVESVRGDAIPVEALDGLDLAEAPRILFKTRREGPPTEWSDDFAHLSPELATRLSEEGALLVGLDTPSVDPATSKSLEAHHVLFGGEVAILENLRLDHVQPGQYFLIAAPVALEGMDGGPVRAVLMLEDP